MPDRPRHISGALRKIFHHFAISRMSRFLSILTSEVTFITSEDLRILCDNLRQATGTCARLAAGGATSGSMRFSDQQKFRRGKDRSSTRAGLGDHVFELMQGRVSHTQVPGCQPFFSLALALLLPCTVTCPTTVHPDMVLRCCLAVGRFRWFTLDRYSC